jgi:hypothetical protein
VPAIAGRIGRLDAFRDDAFDMHGTGFGVKRRALSDDMVAGMQAQPRVCQQRAEALLALDQWYGAHILAVEVQQIEQE